MSLIKEYGFWVLGGTSLLKPNPSPHPPGSIAAQQNALHLKLKWMQCMDYSSWCKVLDGVTTEIQANMQQNMNEA